MSMRGEFGVLVLEEYWCRVRTGGVHWGERADWVCVAGLGVCAVGTRCWEGEPAGWGLGLDR